MDLLGFALGTKAIINMLQSDKMNTEAEKRVVKALNRQSDAENKLYNQKRLTEQSLKKLVNRKKGIISTSIADFISLYERIGKINFNQSDGMSELLEGSQLSTIVNEMQGLITVANKSLTPQQTYITFLLGGVPGLIKKEAELNLANAKMLDSTSRVVESQAESIIVVLDSIYQVSERISKLLAQLNLLLRKSIETTSLIIEKNGRSRLNYSQQDKDCIRTLINTADAVKKIIDAPLFEKDGEISQKAREVIEIGENYLKEINMMIIS